MVRFGDRGIAKERFYAAKSPIKIWDVNVNNIGISKLFKIKTNSKYLNGYLDKNIGPLVLIMPKMSEYFKTFKVKERNNKLMSFCIDEEKLLEKLELFGQRLKILKILN